MGNLANELKERSKNDHAMIVGSEIRAAICELEAERDKEGALGFVHAELVRRLAAQRDALLVACKALVVWAEWHKERGAKTPKMNEPNTGAIEQARSAIAKAEQK